MAGTTLGQLAERAGRVAPPDLRRAKGWVGTLFEDLLGATAKSRAEPDFEALGVEMKSIPLRRDGTPLETTFVCTIPLCDVGDQEWRESRVFHKLRRVLWVPVLAERSLPVPERLVGTAVLWSPSETEEKQLKWDWDELSGLIGRGDAEAITGHLGQVMQVRPKAANSRARRLSIDEDGRRVLTLPRGFYLRPAFTKKILQQRLLLPR